MINVENSN